MSSPPALSFSLLSPPTKRFGPRLGNALLKHNNTEIQVPTPGFLTSSSRGVVPHLSRDHYASSAIRWVHLPFESFLDVLPPVPTLAPGENPLHTFLGYSRSQHILSMSVRDPADGRDMPTNGNTHISAYCMRGVRKVTPADWKSYVYSCKPDIVFALGDTPFTNPPYSQKRLTKSIERSASWLSNLISPSPHEEYKPNVFVHMAGANSIPARKAFANSLLEAVFGPEAEAIKPLQNLDQGVIGYSFDLIPIRLSLEAAEKKHQDPFNPPTESVPPSPPTEKTTTDPSLSQVDLDPVVPPHTCQLSPLLQASLESLPIKKPRLVNTVQTPHEILRLISSVGIDLFDSQWAQRAADIGVSLDFTFPVPSSSEFTSSAPKQHSNNKRDIGHNLYDPLYTEDFSGLGSNINHSCSCIACAPIAPNSRIYHGVDTSSYSGEPEPESEQNTNLSERRIKPSFSRAYLHHLLHTHEMSAHSLLVMHNLAILEQFFVGIRGVLEKGEGKEEDWEREVKRFLEVYDEDLKVFEEARVMWREVDLARGKGRLAREKAKQDESTLGTAVEL